MHFISIATKHKLQKLSLILLCLIPIILLSVFMIIYIFQKFSWFGLNLEDLYFHLNDGIINNDSVMTFEIESNDCRLLGKFAGPDFRLIESIGANKKCKDYVYKKVMIQIDLIAN